MKIHSKLTSLFLVAFLVLMAGCGSQGGESSESQDSSKEVSLSQEEENSEEKTGSESSLEQSSEKTVEESSVSEEVSTGSAEEPLRVLTLKGPSGMGMVSLMKEAEDASDQSPYHFELSGAIDEIAPKLTKGEIDIAAVPANMASVLYNKLDKDVQVLAINTLGVLSIVERGEGITSVADLKGKTLYASGKGASPEYVLNYILQSNGVDPAEVDIQWKSEHSECLVALTGNESGLALLPQPFTSVAQTKMEDLRIALDLTEEWAAIQELRSDEQPKSSLVMGVLIARRSTVEENPERIKEFLTAYQKSVDFVNGDVEEAAKLIGHFDIVEEAIAKKAIPNSNIVFIDGEDCKSQLSGYLQVLFDADPKSVGGQLPADDFYFMNK